LARWKYGHFADHQTFGVNALEPKVEFERSANMITVTIRPARRDSVDVDPPGVPTTATPEAKPTAAAGPPRRGGMLMTPTQTDWITFDNIYNSANGSAALMVYDTLFFLQLDEKGTWRATPGLIEKWETADTSQTWYLRKGVTFHDRSPWNADSLKWNIERMLSDPKSLAASVLGNLDPQNPVTVLDQSTVKINLTSPAPALIESVSAGSDSAAYTYPISRPAFEKIGPDQSAAIRSAPGRSSSANGGLWQFEAADLSCAGTSILRRPEA